LGYDKKLRILFIYDDTDFLLAIMPLCRVRRRINRLFRYTAIEFISQQWAGNYIDCISAGLTREQAKWLRNWMEEHLNYDILNFRYIPEDSNYFTPEGEKYTQYSACMEIEGTDYEGVRKKYFSRNLKHKLNRIHNKIERNSLNIEYKSRRGRAILEYFGEIGEVSISKEYSDKQSVYRSKTKTDFIMDLISNFGENSKCLFMYFEGVLCAYNLGFYHAGKYTAIDAAYNRNIPELKQYSIGNLIYDKLIEDTITSKTPEFSFGTGIDSYKLRFTKQTCRLYYLLEKRNTVKGRIAFARLDRDRRIGENALLEELHEKLPDQHRGANSRKGK